MQSLLKAIKAYFDQEKAAQEVAKGKLAKRIVKEINAWAKVVIVEIMDERNYYFQQSAAVSTLRSLGFQEHELPATGDDGLLVGHGE